MTQEKEKTRESYPICTKCGHEACWICWESGRRSCDLTVEQDDEGGEPDFEMCCDGRCTYEGVDNEEPSDEGKVPFFTFGPEVYTRFYQRSHQVAPGPEISSEAAGLPEEGQDGSRRAKTTD